jgi:DNA polymerase phi
VNILVKDNMSKKRKAEDTVGRPGPPPTTDSKEHEKPKKRKREVDIELVQVYNDLADEQEEVRLAAAHTLLTKIYKPGVIDDDRTKAILTRLFGGLCSSRKSARLGFSVALTELLSQLRSAKLSDTNFISAKEILDILEAQSAPESGTSGQDERDHYFGRVFGAEAVLKSGLLFENDDGHDTGRLVDLLGALALKKPWLRQECGWILYSCIADRDNRLPQRFAENVLERLVSLKLIRTPEGVAIWLAATARFQNARLPASAWKYGNPLSRKGVSVLAEILKDARSHADGQDSELSAQGSARWNARLHFVWDVVLTELFRAAEQSHTNGKHGQKSIPNDDRLTFDLFWKSVVDQSLFAESSSAERKTWGFSLWRKVFDMAPPGGITCTFTPQATRCLTNSLKGSERLLERSAQRLTQRVQAYFTNASHESSKGIVAAAYVRALLLSVSHGDFDQITKTRTVQNLLDLLDPQTLSLIDAELDQAFFEATPAQDSNDIASTASMQKSIILLRSKLVSARIRHWELSKYSRTVDIESADLELVVGVLKTWIREVCTSPPDAASDAKKGTVPVLSPHARAFVRERLDLALEHALRLGRLGGELIEQILLHLHELESARVEMATEFDPKLESVVQTGWSRLSSTIKPAKKSVKPQNTGKKPSRGQDDSRTALSSMEGMRLLYCLVLFQIYCGDVEAIQILQELLEYDSAVQKEKPKHSKVAVENASADSVLEMLLSFASRPSKLMRRITVQIFDALAPSFTIQAFEPLFRVLETKESIKGQQEMFQAGGDDDIDVDDDDGSDSDSAIEEVDSDVEIASVSDTSGSIDDSAHTSDEEEDETDQDEELARFDAALASALGTRSLQPDDIAQAKEGSESSSDEDMDDDQMEELDAKLAEVFRARNEQQNRNKKKEAKDAKENIVNFKNRVLDLIESYLKRQQRQALAIDLLVPLLKLARTTQEKQLAQKACKLVQDYSSRCKGPNVPELRDESQVQHALEVLRSVHEEATLESSNAQSDAASLSSLLVVKALVQADPGTIKSIVEVYASTRVRQLTEKKCWVLPGFFAAWNNWCQTAKEKLQS